jgi:hypothetical protein
MRRGDSARGSVVKVTSPSVIEKKEKKKKKKKTNRF